MAASCDGDTDKILECLSHGASINYHLEPYAFFPNDNDYHTQIKKGDTPLHGSAITGNIRAATLLLREGADINIQNDFGETPLMNSIRPALENLYFFDFLIKNGADLLIKNHDGETVMEMLIRFKMGGFTVADDFIDILNGDEQNETHFLK